MAFSSSPLPRLLVTLISDGTPSIPIIAESCTEPSSFASSASGVYSGATRWMSFGNSPSRTGPPPPRPEPLPCAHMPVTENNSRSANFISRLDTSIPPFASLCQVNLELNLPSILRLPIPTHLTPQSGPLTCSQEPGVSQWTSGSRRVKVLETLTRTPVNWGEPTSLSVGFAVRPMTRIRDPIPMAVMSCRVTGNLSRGGRGNPANVRAGIGFARLVTLWSRPV